MLVWVPAGENLSPLFLDPELEKEFVEDIRDDVFAFTNVRTFTVILPGHRCVRFDSSDQERTYTVLPKDHYDDIDWRGA